MKTLRILAIIFLISIVFFPVIQFVAPRTGTSLALFSVLSLLYISGVAVIGRYLARASGGSEENSAVSRIAIFLILSGACFSVALGMGAPPRDATEFLSNERFELVRGIMLLAAVSCTGFALLQFSVIVQMHFSRNVSALYLFIAAVAMGMSVYDFIWGTFIIPNDIRRWVAEGKDAASFFTAYDMKNMFRSIGRVLIYLISISTFVAAWKAGLMRPWVSVLLILICVLLLSELVPLMISDPSAVNRAIGMVPALALSPLYLAGIYLAASRKTVYALKTQ
jgi:hypothetical protein